MAFRLTSTAFREGDVVPRQFTCDGDDAPPPLEVSDAPPTTKSFALIMDDPDAPRGTFTHWLVYDIPVGGPRLQPKSAKTIKNGFGREGYGGPCPPPGHGPHRYCFTLYALDVESLAVKGRNRADLETALGPHTLATARLMGRYERLKK
jgi:Raf kinase inhibitor-like YbhB/YbcL family protein